VRESANDHLAARFKPRGKRVPLFRRKSAPRRINSACKSDANITNFSLTHYPVINEKNLPDRNNFVLLEYVSMIKSQLRRREKKERRGRVRGERKKKEKKNRFHLEDPDYRVDSIMLRYYIFFKRIKIAPD